jgi:hypothetical protein
MSPLNRTNLWHRAVAQAVTAAGLFHVVSDDNAAFNDDANPLRFGHARKDLAQLSTQNDGSSTSSASSSFLSSARPSAFLPLFCNASAEASSQKQWPVGLHERLPISCASDATMVLLMAPLSFLMQGLTLKHSDLVLILNVLSHSGALDGLETW